MTTGRDGARTLSQRWRGVVSRYGWRAYAVPVLVVVTVVVLVQGLPSGHHAEPRAGSHVVVEGGGPSDAAYTRGTTPRPVTIELTGDERNCAENTYARHVIVSIAEQHLWACRGHRQVLQTPVTTGRSAHHDQTPTGSWRVQGRERNRYLVGKDYRDYVHYWVPFNGDFGLHDAPWEKTGYGSQDYRTRGSHGCVHVPEADMAWLYRWVTVGGTVVTVED